MKNECSKHPDFLEVYCQKDHKGVATEVGILCAKCGTKRRVWPERPKQYYCRFCGHTSGSKREGCPKCGSSIPLKEA